NHPAVRLYCSQSQHLGVKGRDPAGWKFVTQTTRRPRRARLSYHCRTAAEDLRVPCGPKSMVSLYDGFRASGNSSTAVIRPTRISIFRKSSSVAVTFVSSREWQMSSTDPPAGK